MYIGKIGINQNFHNMGAVQKRAGVPHIQSSAMSSLKDRLEIGSRYQHINETGIYGPSGNQMQVMPSVTYTYAAPDERLKRELLPPSEQGELTEEDALIDQYMKQSRIDGYFDGDTFVCDYSKPVKLILRDNISRSDLENFQKELEEKGLGTEIDWRGVKEDFIQMGVRFDNVERLEQKADFLASRYAVLKDRIQNQFTGEKQESELQKLEQIYAQAKEEMADSYADNIGGFYEGLGQSGTADEMRNSVFAVIDGKADAYLSYLGQNDIYSEITAPEKQWLKQDDAYMASQLRKHVSEDSAQFQADPVQAPYSEKDLVYAGMYAKALSSQLQRPDWNVEKSDSALGSYLAEQYKALESDIEKSGISDKLSDILKKSFEPFAEKFMDSLDSLIDDKREQAAVRPWMAGLIRTEYIDRNAVYRSFGMAVEQ